MATAEETLASATTTAPAAEAAPAVAPAPRTFQSSDLLAETVRRKLRGRQDEFARAFSARLSSYLRLDFGVTVARLQVVTFQKFVEQTVTPTHMALFKAEPWRGIGLLEIPPQLGLNIVDRQLGGAGKVERADRALTELESALLSQVVTMLLADWCAQWRDLQELKPTLLGHEVDIRFLNMLPREAMLLEFAFETASGGAKQQFRIGFPYDSLQPWLRRLGETSRVTAGDSAAVVLPAGTRWSAQFDNVPVALVAACEGWQLSARQVAALKVGDTLPVEAQRWQAVHLRLGHAPCFVGVLGKSDDGRWAVQVTRKLENPSHEHKH